MNVSAVSLSQTDRHAPSRRASRNLDRFDLVFLGVFCATIACLAFPSLFGGLSRVPEALVLPFVQGLNLAIDGLNATFSPAFRALSFVFDFLIRLLECGLAATPAPILLAIAAIAAHRAAGIRLAAMVVLTGIYIIGVGYWSETLRTMTLVLFALPLAILLGFLLGALGFRFPRLSAPLDVVLDFMQTVPAFAFLVPMIVLFGFGPVPGVIASIVYAAPAMARNVRLGLETTPPAVLEAALMSGCTPWQIFFNVRLPCARQQLLLGVNQTIMATLSMVIFAAAIGGFEDIGWEVLRTARRADFGNGLIIGLIITLIAILLDRATVALSRQRHEIADPSLARRRLFLALLVLVLAVVLSRFAFPAELQNLRGPLAAWLAKTMLAFSVTFDPILTALKNGATTYLLLPLRVGFMRALMPSSVSTNVTALVTLLYALAFIGLCLKVRSTGARAAIAFAGLVLYAGLATYPWAPMILTICAFSWYLGGPRLAAKTGLACAFILLTGFWQSAMLSVYIAFTSVIACVVVGGGLGIAAAESAWVSRVMRPVNDFLQTIPPFVILIPVIMFFKIGDFSSFLAIVSYSVAAMARYTENGLRAVPQAQVEAGLLSGCSRLQMIFMVKLPTAGAQILLGLRQTIMYALAMLSVAALVGSRGLGQDVYVALGKADPGLGLTAGICIALLALISDGFLRGLSGGLGTDHAGRA